MPAILNVALIALVVTAAVYDFRFRRIPNWLNLTGVIAGLALNTLLFSYHGFGAGLAGILLPLALYIPLYLLRAMGAGDAKLMAAVGAIAGPRNWIAIFLCTALAGGLVAVVIAAKRKRLRRTVMNTGLLAAELMNFQAPAERHEELDVRNSRSLRSPHGVAIAAGSLCFIGTTLFLAQ